MLKPFALAPLVVAWLWTAPPAPEPESPTPAADDFELFGSAQPLGADCIRLTEDQQWQTGAAWSTTPVDLDAPFDVELSLSFGDRDALGADGIVFVLAGAPDMGWRGEMLGLSRRGPSLGIELDTYQNKFQNDPAADHLAFDIHGITYHFDAARRPEGLDALDAVELPNLEDGRPHDFRVQWSPEDELLKVSLDGVERATFPAPLVRELFGEARWVRWGLSSATGRKTNAHDVCLPSGD